MCWRAGIGRTKDGGEEDEGENDSENDVNITAPAAEEQTTKASRRRRARQYRSGVGLQTTVSGEAREDPGQP